MKITEVTIGCAYAVQSRGIAVVVDIGKFSDASSYGEHRTLEWNGATFTFAGWYNLDRNVAQRRVAIVMLSNSVGQMAVVTPAQLMYAVPDEIMQREVSKFLGQRTKRETKENWEQHKENYSNQIRDLVRMLTPDVNPRDLPYWSRDNEYGRILFSSELPKMILLYLQYLQMKNESVGGNSDVESLIDTFRDSVSGLRGMVESPETDIDALTASALGHVASQWSTCSTTTITKVVTP
jgi:hypothetical protein